MSRHSRNFQLTQIFDPNQMSIPSSNFKEFGNFIYKDHVTRLKYNLDNLKSQTSTFHSKQTLPSFVKNHKHSKSMGNMPVIKSKFKTDHKDQMEIKKWQLSNFLEQLQMINKIRANRNHIVSGTEKVLKRKTLFPRVYPSLLSKNRKDQNVDIIKQQIRKQVNQLSTQLFRQYMENSNSYRMVFNQLNTVSNKGTLDTNKIKQIKHKIKQCTRKKQGKIETGSILKKIQLDSQENSIYDEYFLSVGKQIDEQIRLKIKHEASYNWKYGKKSTAQEMINNYQHDIKLFGKEGFCQQ